MTRGRPPGRRINAMGKRGSTLIVVILLYTLAVAGALSWKAQQAARSHRTTAENVLRDYARFANWEFSRLARRELNRVLGAHLDALAVSCYGRETLPDVQAWISGKYG